MKLLEIQKQENPMIRLGKTQIFKRIILYLLEMMALMKMVRELKLKRITFIMLYIKQQETPKYTMLKLLKIDVIQKIKICQQLEKLGKNPIKSHHF